ncbi:MAG: ABC transporter ATP-binding protein [Bdellovibrionota bacterium]
MTYLLATNGIDAYWPLLLREGLDLIEKKAALSELSRVCFLFLVVLMLLAFTRYNWRKYFGEFHTTAMEDIRQTIFRHLMGMSQKFFQKNPVGELMSLITNDVQSFRQAIGPGFLIIADGVIIISFVLPIMISINPEWTWKTLILFPLLPFLIWKVMRAIHQNYKTQQHEFAKLTAFTQENVAGVRVIKSFTKENLRSEQYSAQSKQFEKTCNKVALIDSMFGPVMELGIAFGSVVLLFISVDDVLSGAVTIGTFVIFQRYIQKMIWPVSAFGFGISYFQKGFASFDRIKEILKWSPDIKDEGTIELTEIKSFELRNVSFSYPFNDQEALHDLSFRLEKGQKLGVIGGIGSGKTTLLQLMVRLYEPQLGEILINDRPIAEYTLRSLRNCIKLIPQDPFLFSQSVADNVLFANPAPSDDFLASTLESVQMDLEVAELPHQHRTQLGEKGVNISGGQKQRLTIARALASPFELLLFDDNLSAIDTKTENYLEKSLFLDHQRTIVVVSHRLSSLMKMDKLLVLKEGQSEYFGSFAKAFEESPTFKSFLQLQEMHHGS